MYIWDVPCRVVPQEHPCPKIRLGLCHRKTYAKTSLSGRVTGTCGPKSLCRSVMQAIAAAIKFIPTSTVTEILENPCRFVPKSVPFHTEPNRITNKSVLSQSVAGRRSYESVPRRVTKNKTNNNTKKTYRIRYIPDMYIHI